MSDATNTWTRTRNDLTSAELALLESIRTIVPSHYGYNDTPNAQLTVVDRANKTKRYHSNDSDAQNDYDPELVTHAPVDDLLMLGH